MHSCVKHGEEAVRTEPSRESFPLVLASGSPRRAKILEQHGVKFSVLKTDAPEVVRHHDPEGTVVENAKAKLAAALSRMAQRHDVAGVPSPPRMAAACPQAALPRPALAADTIVWFNNRIYGKPRDLAEAAQFLRELSGNTHAVFTGLAYAAPDGAIRTAVSRSGVIFRRLDDAAIASYIARVNPLDRAGAYDIDESGDFIVASFTGSYENIMGLPLEPLREFGILRQQAGT